MAGDICCCPPPYEGPPDCWLPPIDWFGWPPMPFAPAPAMDPLICGAGGSEAAAGVRGGASESSDWVSS
ncbi:hypothetical protein EES47_01115 [Streptomyces sp. ADI98-12]|nr:hypothetical protein EES47_01115 [Streptomyces sp. ADI98-12]